jgi:REP element-mobilizing transposase RayT
MTDTQKPGTKALRAGRFSQQNGIYFITVNTDQRIPWFQEFAFARIMCGNLEHTASLVDSKSLCWVVMPDHFHILLQLGTTPLQSVIRRLKSRSAVQLNNEIGRSGRFWSPGYHDHALRKEEDMLNIARYIVANPLRAGLVPRIGNYPFWNTIWL